ncbi:MAG: response regulator [Nitrososphaera sp.]|nr:response regulator [Nitrososphaera sp.]
MAGKCVLIVDDESNIRLTLRICLELEGYQIEEATNGQEALDMVRLKAPDIILLDLSMPVLGGMEVLRKLQEVEAAPPLIILTAYGSIPNAVEAMKLGAIDFLEKPVTPETVRTTVARVLSGEARARVEEAEGIDAIVALAKHALRNQNFSRAESLLMAAAAVRTSDPEIFNLIGVLHELSGREDEARKFYGKAIALNRHYEPAQQNMRRLYELYTFGRSQEEVTMGEE